MWHMVQKPGSRPLPSVLQVSSLEEQVSVFMAPIDRVAQFYS